MRPIITIESFSNGILSDATQNVTNGGQYFVNLNIHKEDSVLEASQKLTQETDIFTDLVKWIVYDENEPSNKYWALGSNGTLYRTTAIGGTWTVDSSTGGSGQGLAIYNGHRYYATATVLRDEDGNTNTLDSDTEWHPMCVYLGSLFVGAGRYVSKLESDGTFTQQKLTLPAGNRVKSLDVYGDRLVIGTMIGSTITQKAESYLFTWDGTTDFPEQSFYLQENGQNALISWENILLDFAGIQGNLYAYNGSFLDKAKKIPDVDATVGDYVYVNPGAVAQFGGNVLAGVTLGSGSALGGVYEFGRITEDLPFAMTLPYPISAGVTDVQIGAILTCGTNQFLVSWKDNDAGTYGLDALDTTAKASSGYFTTNKYELADGSEQRLIKGVVIVAEPLPTGTSITVEYDADDSGSFSSGGTITSSNQDELLYFPFRAKVAQFKFTLNANANTTPKVKRIEIY